jgi:hypothetical protein
MAGYAPIPGNQNPGFFPPQVQAFAQTQYQPQPLQYANAYQPQMTQHMGPPAALQQQLQAPQQSLYQQPYQQLMQQPMQQPIQLMQQPMQQQMQPSYQQQAHGQSSFQQQYQQPAPGAVIFQQPQPQQQQLSQPTTTLDTSLSSYKQPLQLSDGMIIIPF